VLYKDGAGLVACQPLRILQGRFVRPGLLGNMGRLHGERNARIA